jgi:hypothetical protein
MECQRNNEEDRRRRDAEIRANFAKARAMVPYFLNRYLTLFHQTIY